MNLAVLQPLMLFPDRPGLSLFLLFLAATFLMWMARRPFEDFIRRAFLSLANGLRFAGRWLDRHARELFGRANDLACEYFLQQLERKIDSERIHLEKAVREDLAAYPALNHKLTELVNEYNAAFKDAQEPKLPSMPEYRALNRRIEEATEKSSEDRKALARIRDELNKEHQARVKEYRRQSKGRIKALRKLASPVKELAKRTGKLASLMEGLNARVQKTEQMIQTYITYRSGDDRELLIRAGNHSVLTRFLIGLFVLVIVCGGGFVNFMLIQRPMAEMVGGGYLGSMPIASVAAMTLLLLELAAGLVLMEAWGVTHLAPQFENLDPKTRKTIIMISAGLLLCMACAEAGLAVLREKLIAADVQTMTLLGGTDTTVAQNLMGKLPVTIQAMLGFVIPLVLAGAAIPIEMLFHTARIVAQKLLCLLMWAVSGLLRLIGFLFDRLHRMIVALYDFLIFFWLALERWFGPLFGRLLARAG